VGECGCPCECELECENVYAVHDQGAVAEVNTLGVVAQADTFGE